MIFIYVSKIMVLITSALYSLFHVEHFKLNCPHAQHVYANCSTWNKLSSEKG